MRPLALLCVFVSSFPAFAQVPPLPKGTVTPAGDHDLVVLESGATAKVLVPRSLPKGTRPGLVLALHGHGGNPDGMMGYGRGLADHRGEVWCAYRASGKIGADNYQYDGVKDGAGIPEITRFVLSHYKIDTDRVVVIGFSAGGAMACMVAPQNPELYAGFVTCAAPDYPGGRRGSDLKTLRAVCFLGEQDQNFALASQARSAVPKHKGAVAFRAITGLGHDLPDPVYLNDAFNFIADRREVGDDRTLPLQPDHPMAEVKGRKPALRAIVVGWKSSKGPAGVTRSKAEAKTLADGLLKKLKAAELALAEALAQSDDPESRDAEGAVDPGRLAEFGKKLVAKATSIKPETWELVETDGRFWLLRKDKPSP